MRNHLLIILIFLFSLAASAAEKWQLTTLEWPPFVCSQCPEQGAAAKALREALKTVNVEVEFVFKPWTQAITESRNSKNFVGYFPAWAEEVYEGFTPSIPLFDSPLGFIEPKSKPLVWDKITDLKGKTIGSVKDYGNSKDFNKAVRDGIIKNVEVLTDEENIKSVAEEKIDGALIDVNNARWFLTKKLTAEAKKVQINATTLETKDLHVAFNDLNKDKKAKIVESLKNIDTQRIVDNYIKTYLK